MKVMILSDSHAMSKTGLMDLLHNNHVDYYIHCGDIYMSYDGMPLNNFYLVRGNNDYGNTIPNTRVITLDHLTFFITHGHLYDVGYNLEKLYRAGKEKKADIICFGHTHQPYLDEIDNTLIINPGSVSYPRGQYRNPTYCILDTKTKEVIFYDVKTLEPCDPFNIQRPKKSKKNKKEPFFKKWFK